MNIELFIRKRSWRGGYKKAPALTEDLNTKYIDLFFTLLDQHNILSMIEETWVRLVETKNPQTIWLKSVGKDESGELVTSELYRLLFYAGDFFAHGDIMYAP